MRIRAFAVALALAMMACRSEPEPEASEPLKAPPALAVVGDWVRVAPANLGIDTLRLRSDSTADGLWPWPAPPDFARISNWRIKYMSKDPVGTRKDWRGGYSDGGDAACMRWGEPGCVSLPMLCVGGGDEYACEAFALTPDSLLFSSGLQYVRIKPAVTQLPRD